MDFHEFSAVIVYFLPEAQGLFIRIHFLQIPRQPAKAPSHIHTITSSTTGQLLPVTELPFILAAVTHE